MTRRAIALGVLALAFTGCGSTPATRGALTVRGAWARDSASTQTTAAVYFTVRNSGDTPVTITSVAVSETVATGTMLHRVTTEGSGDRAVLGMAPMGPVTVPAHGKVTFRPGASHVMLTGLGHPLRAGETFHITLHRADGDRTRAIVEVRGV